MDTPTSSLPDAEAPSTLRPVDTGSRIAALDVTRGFALLGIFMVNIQLFGEPFGTMMVFEPPASSSATDVAVYYFVKIFCESKFYPLFSLMFGIGLALQFERARAVGRSLIGAGLRRIVSLSVMGLLHGILLWYGDILFLYSTAGIWLLLLVRCRPKVLARLGGVCLGIGVLLGTGVGALMLVGQPAPAHSTTDDVSVPASTEQAGVDTDARGEASGETGGEAPESSQGEGISSGVAEGAGEEGMAETDGEAEPAWARTPAGRIIMGFKRGTMTDNPEPPPMASEIWMGSETEAFGRGPYVQAVAIRALDFGMMLIFVVFGFWWSVMAMFFFGAALLKAGLYEPGHRRWHRRFVVLAVCVALPLAMVVAFAPKIMPFAVAMLVINGLTFLVGPLMALGYLGAITLIVDKGWLRPLTSAMANTGRMGLTNYLMQTVVACAIFQHWGWGMFGQTTRTERIGMVLAIFAAQLVISTLWLRCFRFGPMERVWRSVTYLRPPGLGKAA